ncbi:MAG: PAS domain-containing protein, partial [Chloroflexales bacterium]|nr:PAS domain-containing protein [Chloroflexales bacterium]
MDPLALLISLLDTLPVGVTVLDEGLSILRVNPALAALLGRPAAVLLGQSLPALWPAVAPHCALALATDQPDGPRQVAAASPDTGGAVWQISLYRLALPDTGAPGLCLVAREVDARRHADAALHSNEQRLRLALEVAQLTAWEWDLATGTFTYSTHKSTYFSLPPGQLTRTQDELTASVYPPDRPAYEQSVADALQRGGLYQLQVRVYAPGGHLCWLEVRGLVQHDASGQPVRVVGVTRDISVEQRRAAAQALHLAISQALGPDLDGAATLEALARLPLPELADTCVIYLCDDDGLAWPAAACAGDPAQPAPLANLPAPLSREDMSSPLGEVLRTGASRLLAAVPADLAPAFGPLAPRTALLVPLAAQGRTLGVLLLGRTAGEFGYDVADLELAEALARRGAETLAWAQLQASA